MIIRTSHDRQALSYSENAIWIDLNASATTAGEIYRIELDLPLTDVQGYWHPGLYRPRFLLDWSIRHNSAVNYAFPFLSFFNTQHQNRLSLGLSELVEDVQIQADIDQGRHVYHIVIKTLAAPGKKLRLWVDRSPRPWTSSLESYRRGVIGRHPLVFPEASWRPVFCTWYARHRNFDAAWVESAALIASQLGFGTFILDDGWSCTDASALRPSLLPNWYGPIGEWRPAPSKFPDFTEHVRRVRALGMAYMLWIAPLMLGVDTEVGRRLRQGRQANTGFYSMSPAEREQTAVALEAVQALLQSTPLDGLKIDFLDEIKPSLEQPCGRSMHTFMRRLSEVIRNCCPNAMIEYRQNYTGPGTLELATNFRALDVPYDFVENVQRIAQVRLSLGDGVPVHADPSFWHPNESPVTIARHLIASLAGVPMISVDLAATPEPIRRLIAYWLNVYHRHLNIFRKGHWTIHYHFDQVAALTCESENESIALIYDTAGWQRLELDPERFMLINGSGQSIDLPRVRAGADFNGHIQSLKVLPPGAIAYTGKAAPAPHSAALAPASA